MRAAGVFHTYLRAMVLVCCVLCAGSIAMADDSPPDWMSKAAGRAAPTYDKDTKAVVLFKEENVTLDGGGRLTTVERCVLRILTHDGRKEAVAVGFYLADFSDVKDVQIFSFAVER